jgi:threonine/homoserine/homoserine lactone efflux protein
MPLDSWLIFCSIAFIATITPGPAILLVMSNSLQHGPVKTIPTMLGNISGLFLMSSLSILGLSTLILHSSFAFNVVKFLGVAYLIYLGVKLWRKGIKLTIEPGDPLPSKPTALYRQGILVALTNPKAIAFTTALFPQFIALDRSLILQFSILVFTFMLFSFVCLFGYALVAEKTKKRASGFLTNGIFSKIFGGVFIGAGLSLAFTKSG